MFAEYVSSRSSVTNLQLTCYSVDITEGIPKQGFYSYSMSYTHFHLPHFSASVAYCRNCERFLSPPGIWTIAQPESPELLSICLKKLKGLNKVRLTDARFIWTEPHSKRLRVAVTIQKEVCPYKAQLLLPDLRVVLSGSHKNHSRTDVRN